MATTHTSSTTVLIVGAGPTGLALSLALARRGIAHRIVEPQAGPNPRSRAMGIEARTMEVLARLGLADAILAEALPLKGNLFHLGRRVVAMPFQGVHPDYPAMVILPQARTEAILEAAGPGVERGRRFTGIGDGIAIVTDPSGRPEGIRADWIVGCDGAHSAVRRAIGVPFDGKEYAARVLLADCVVEGLEQGLFHVFTERPLIGFAAPGGLWRLVTVLPDDAPEPVAGAMAPFQREGVKARDPIWWSAFRLQQRRVPSMRHGRILLAGDAAHVHSPAGGQGMNVGIQDAWSLAAAIAAGDTAVDAWAGARGKVADKVLRATDRTTRAMLSGPGFLAPVRDATISLAARSRFIARRLEAGLAGLDYPPIIDRSPG